MGGSGTLVDGVRRWFQRRTSIVVFNSSSNNNHNNNQQQQLNDTHVFVTGFLADSSSLQEKQQEEGEIQIVVDFDLSGLKLIKVPKRLPFTTLPMDSHKKVSLSLS